VERANADIHVKDMLVACLSNLTSNIPPDSPGDGTTCIANLQTDITTTDQSAELDEQNAVIQIPSSSNQPTTLDNKVI
jgi:hypothetical protein